jgi:hypothetical protein
VALTTLATLLLELSLTRIFSVVFYYHFAFLAISIALFGLGVGGVFSYIVAGWKTPLFRKLGYLSMLNSLLVMAALAVVVAQKEEPGAWGLTLVYFTTALPFFVPEPSSRWPFRKPSSASTASISSTFWALPPDACCWFPS